MGVASDITGAKYWVIDSNKTVYVYNATTGALLGSWAASGLTTPQGITTDGTHIWIIDSGSDKVFNQRHSDRPDDQPGQRQRHLDRR